MKFIVISFFLIVAHASSAQNSGGTLYMIPSIQVFSFNNINQSISNADFGEVPVTFGNVIGGYGVVNNWVIGGEGSYFSGTNSSPNTSTTLSGGWGYFYGGYTFNKTKWRIVPALGIGFGGCFVNATRNTQVPDLAALLTDQPNSSQISLGDALLHTSLSFERFLSKQVYIGIKASYNLGLTGKQPWEADGLQNSTEDAFGGFQAGIKIGFLLANKF
jgi:hypothetical protein